MEDFTRAVGFAAALEDAIAAELRPWARRHRGPRPWPPGHLGPQLPAAGGAVGRRPDGVRGDHDLTFISAHEEDWPQEFYGGLGFERVGTVSRFRRS
jgi:hypothetical protein